MILALIGILIALFISQGIYRNWDVYTGKRKTYDALAEHLNEPTEVENAFPDDSQFEGSWWGNLWKRYEKLTKPWFAFGPLSNYSFSRFRNYPITWFAIRGNGRFRFETDKPRSLETFQWSDTKFDMWFGPALGFENYFSRVQYYTKWHLAFHWPLFVSAHYGTWQFYLGFKRDADRIYWLAFFIGRTWK